MLVDLAKNDFSVQKFGYEEQIWNGSVVLQLVGVKIWLFEKGADDDNLERGWEYSGLYGGVDDVSDGRDGTKVARLESKDCDISKKSWALVDDVFDN